MIPTGGAAWSHLAEPESPSSWWIRLLKLASTSGGRQLATTGSR